MKELIASLRGHAEQGRHWLPPPSSQFLIWATELEEQLQGNPPEIVLSLLNLSSGEDILPEWEALLEKAKLSRYRLGP